MAAWCMTRTPQLIPRGARHLLNQVIAELEFSSEACIYSIFLAFAQAKQKKTYSDVTHFPHSSGRGLWLPPRDEVEIRVHMVFWIRKVSTNVRDKHHNLLPTPTQSAREKGQ